ncbi:DNA repair exonuclease [Bacillus timonensis]|nr:DNA repair exonuclease [Bacillus timonensis]
MDSIRFIHAADLHLDSPFISYQDLPRRLHKRLQESTFHSFTRVIDLAIKERVDFIIIAGDLFDIEDRSLKAQSRFRNEMTRLEEHSIQAYVIHGNHDFVNSNNLQLKWPSNVHVFSEKEVEMKEYIKNNQVLAHLYGYSYPKQAVTENVSASYQRQEGATYHIGILHGSSDNSSDHQHYAPFKVLELIKKDFDYWALGHIHKQQILHDRPPILYPGNIQGRHRKETGEKGCFLVTLNGQSASTSFYPTADVIWERLDLSIEGITEFSELVEVCFTEIERMRRPNEGLMLSVEFFGNGVLHEELQNQEIINDLISMLTDSEENRENFVWISTLRVKTHPLLNREELRKDSHFFGDLFQVIDNYNDFDKAISPLFTHPQTRRFLTSLSDAEREEIIKEAEALVLHEILQHKK